MVSEPVERGLYIPVARRVNWQEALFVVVADANALLLPVLNRLS